MSHSLLNRLQAAVSAATGNVSLSDLLKSVSKSAEVPHIDRRVLLGQLLAKSAAESTEKKPESTPKSESSKASPTQSSSTPKPEASKPTASNSTASKPASTPNATSAPKPAPSGANALLQKGKEVGQHVQQGLSDPLKHMGATGASIKAKGKEWLGAADTRVGSEAGKGVFTQAGKSIYPWLAPAALGAGGLYGLNSLLGGGSKPASGPASLLSSPHAIPALLGVLGAGAGGLSSRRNRLRNAVLGALLGVGGGMAYNAMSSPNPSIMQRLQSAMPFKFR